MRLKRTSSPFFDSGNLNSPTVSFDKFRNSVAALGLSLISCTSDHVPPSNVSNITGRDPTNYVSLNWHGASFRVGDRQVLVTYDSACSESEITQVKSRLNSEGAIQSGSIPDIRMYQYEFSRPVDLNHVLTNLESERCVTVASPNIMVVPQVDPIPTPSAYDVYDGFWWLNTIRAREAWGVTTGSTSVPIGILDSGISVATGQFRDKSISYGWRCYDNSDQNNYSFARSDSRSTPFCPVSGSYTPSDHGTWVASIAGSRGDDNFGGVGVAWQNPLISVDLYGGRTTTNYYVLSQGIVLAMNMGARVINASMVPCHDNGSDCVSHGVTIDDTTNFRYGIMGAVNEAYRRNVLLDRKSTRLNSSHRL